MNEYEIKIVHLSPKTNSTKELAARCTMIMRIKQYFVTLFFLIYGVGIAHSQEIPYKFQIESAGVGANEAFLYRVVCDIKGPQIAADVAAECAVYGVIFRGSTASGRNPAQTPLLKSKSLSEEQIAYFDNFFQSKQYQQYITEEAKNNIKIVKIVKIKKEYRAEVIVSLNKRKLRRDLETDGIIEKLGQIFGN